MKIKVMTFNLRVEAKVDGINTFENRKGRVLEIIKNEAPDLIGFQEAANHMRVFLRNNLSEYTVLGCGRDKNYYGESTILAIKRDRFEIISMNNFWLSPFTSTPGSRFGIDQSSCPRITTCARIYSKECSAPFWFYNTHLDHKGSSARLLGATVLMTHINENAKDENYVLTGDFNATPEASEIQFIVNSGATDVTGELPGTFHGFGNLKESIKIDYIFVKNGTACENAYVVPDAPVEGVYISDHNPVCAYIEIN